MEKSRYPPPNLYMHIFSEIFIAILKYIWKRFSARCASQFVGEHPPLYKKNSQCYNIPQIFDKKRPCGGIHKENTMELKLENGRPADTTGRLEKEIRTYDFLDALQVPYQRIDHETLMTIEACKDVDKVLDAVICKNLFLCNRQETNFYLLLLPGDKKFKTKEVSSQLGVARLSFGNETYMEKFLDITPGSVSILGLMNDKENYVQLLIDEDLLKEPYIGCHPCINTSSLKINMKDMMEKIIPAMKHEPIFVKLGQEE